jgi:hypothetical protein
MSTTRQIVAAGCLSAGIALAITFHNLSLPLELLGYFSIGLFVAVIGGRE